VISTPPFSSILILLVSLFRQRLPLEIPCSQRRGFPPFPRSTCPTVDHLPLLTTSSSPPSRVLPMSWSTSSPGWGSALLLVYFFPMHAPANVSPQPFPVAFPPQSSAEFLFIPLRLPISKYADRYLKARRCIATVCVSSGLPPPRPSRLFGQRVPSLLVSRTTCLFVSGKRQQRMLPAPCPLNAPFCFPPSLFFPQD